MKANFNINQLMVSYSCGLTLTALLSFCWRIPREGKNKCGQTGRYFFFEGLTFPSHFSQVSFNHYHYYYPYFGGILKNALKDRMANF